MSVSISKHNLNSHYLTNSLESSHTSDATRTRCFYFSFVRVCEIKVELVWGGGSGFLLRSLWDVKVFVVSVDI